MPAAYRALSNILKAYILVYEGIKRIYGDKPSFVSIAKHMRLFLPCHPGNHLEKAICAWRDKQFNTMILDALAGKRCLDFIGVNYYTHEYVTARGIMGRECFAPHHPERKNAMGWNVSSDSFYAVLLRLKSYGLPVIVTENGTAEDRDDFYEQYLMDHIKALARALRDGVNVKGYMWWSLLDNFEWEKGYRPHFGLYTVEKSYARKSRPHARAYDKICSDNAIEI